MVNRTLRRAYTRTDGDTPVSIGADGSITDLVESGAGTISADDSATVVDGKDTIGDAERVSSSVGAVEIDPNELDEFIARDSDRAGDGSVNPDGTRKRRKRGPNKRTTGAAKAEASVEPFITMVHALMQAKIPEMELAEGEAKRVSDAYIDFCVHHEIPILSEKRMSEINLISALWMVYGTRVIAIRNRMKEEAKVKKARNVTPMQAVQ